MSSSSYASRARLAIVAMLAAMVIYGAGFPIGRFGTTHGLRPEDLVFLRFAIAGPIMLPFFIRRGVRTCMGLGWMKGVALVVTSGAPIALLMNTGLSMSPAAHGAALAPGTVTAVGVVYGIVAARMLPPRLTIVGLMLMVTGLAAVAMAGSATASPKVIVGDILFFATGLLWGFYPIMLLRWRVEPMTGAAIAAVLSMAYIPFYIAAGPSPLLDVPWQVLLVQVVYQGLFSIIVGLWLWGWAARVLGPQAQLFPPLIPVLGTLMAIPTLGEWPGPVQSGGIALIVGGLTLSAFSSHLTTRRAQAA